MKTYPLVILFATLFLLSCGNDDTPSCTTCTSSQTIPFTVCEESNGNASVNGEDTGTSYRTYVDGLVAAGASCGG